MKIINLPVVNSTNDWCKHNDNGEDLIVIARTQTTGRGTKGRNFISDEGGIYLSTLKRYKNFLAKNAFKILINSCVAVCKTLQSLDITPVIRWSNDVLVNGKKICGTLIENTFQGDKITRSIVGIGLNVNNKIPPSLKDIAVSIESILGKSVSLDKILQTLISNLQNEYTVQEYKSYMPWLGGNVILKTEKSEITATALDINESGRLICNINGEVKDISSAEVSIRF
ncbi:MAG: biotin--[acetyl-CoA-carboxylase] ligase [Clostridia bacterium]|nr:biotin--[acetyl-CoA-carboxylase] ligase [Clostridia bacterium]